MNREEVRQESPLKKNSLVDWDSKYFCFDATTDSNSQDAEG